jgi:hypothetical protein
MNLDLKYHSVNRVAPLTLDVKFLVALKCDILGLLYPVQWHGRECSMHAKIRRKKSPWF